jgi:hypothetical protein
MIDIAGLLSNPYVTHLLAMIVGWVGLKQPAVTAAWTKVLWARQAFAKADEMIQLVDAMLKTNGLIPADAPVPPANTIVSVAQGTTSVVEAKKALARK